MEWIATGMSENLKSRLKADLEDEKGHYEAMARLLEEYIESIKITTIPEHQPNSGGITVKNVQNG